MQYRWEATSLEGFVQQLACAYLRCGYVYFVRGEVPEGKNARSVGGALVKREPVDVSKWERARRQRAGLANVQYVRFGRVFVLLATQGQHPLFDAERSTVRDARRTPIRVGGYALSIRGGHVHVRIDLEVYRRLRAYLFDIAIHRRAPALAAEFYGLPFEPYAPVRRQFLNMLRLVNKRRKAAGFELLPYSVLHLRRRIVRPFDPPAAREAA